MGIKNRPLARLQPKRFSTGLIFFPPGGHLLMRGGTFACYKLGKGVSGIYWIEASDADLHPTVHRTTPMTKNDLARNVSSAKVEKPWSIICRT